MPTIKRIASRNERPNTTPALDVVFLHGLAGDPDKTWTAKKRPRPFWPQWLADDNPEAAVWCVGYDAAVSRYRGRPLSILESAVGLLALLRSHGVGERPLCFVGHSLGGLLAKRMIVDATHTYPDYRELADQVAGVVFLATPHDGAAIARVLKSVRIVRHTTLVDDLVDDEPWLLHLNRSYRVWAADRDVDHRVLYETRPQRPLGLVVPRSSADPNLPGVTPIPIAENHSRICKPTGREHDMYGVVNQFVAERLGRRGQTLIPAVPQAKGGDDKLLTAYRVFQGTGWSATLRDLYPRYELLNYMGADFPIWTKLAAPEHWNDLDAPLVELLPGEDPRYPSYPKHFDPAGERRYWEKINSADGVKSFNGATYALERIEMEGGKFRIHARHGTYFHSIATSEDLDLELIKALAENPDRTVGLGCLPRRDFLHEAAGGQGVVLDGRNRAAALSVAATILIDEGDGTYSVILAKRSHAVETHVGYTHVAPSGIFAPINAERRDDPTEFSLRRCILREYAEELFGYKDLEQGEGLLARDVEALPPVRELLEAEREGTVVLRYCGISVPLLTLRPEVYVLIFIRDRPWLDREIERADDSDHYFELNWEYEEANDPDAVRLRLDSDLCPIDPSAVHPSRMVPHAAAALHLCTSVARTLIRAEPSR
jgi:hypothetical protein